MAARILYLVDDLGTRGARTSLVRTLAHLDRERFEPEVAFLWPPDQLRVEIEGFGIRVHAVHARRGDWSLLAVPRITSLIREGDFDIVHTQPMLASVVGRIAARRAKVMVVSEMRGADPEGWVEQVLPPREARNEATVSWLESLTGRVVTRFIASSEAARRGARRGARVSVVPRGQDLASLAERAKDEPDPPLEDPGTPCIVAVGRLTPEKGQRYLIDAMRPVLDVFPNARLLVVGEGSLHRMLQDRAAPLEGHVTFLGNRTDVPALLARADLAVFPSLWVSQAGAVVEAMTLHCPIVATRIPVVADALRDGDTAVLATAANAERLADAMVRVLRDPDSAAAMATRAAEAAERFDIARTTAELESVYGEVLAERR